MNPQLFAARYDDVSMSTAAYPPDENFDEIMDLGARIAFPGGLQRLELTIKAKSKADAHNRYLHHLGQRIIVYDNFIDKFIGGQIFEIVPDGRFVTYICAGSWKRLSMTRWLLGSRPTSGDTDDLIKDVLTDTAGSYPFSNADQGNITAKGVDAGGWVTQTFGGSSTGISGSEAITELVSIGDDADRPVHFYFTDGNFVAPMVLGLPTPYLKSVEVNADPDWQVELKNIAPGGLTVSRNIWNLKTSIKVTYGHYYGEATGSGAANGILTIGAGSFYDQLISPGDVVYNLTTSIRYTIGTIDNAQQLTITDTGATAFSNTNKFTIGVSNKLHTTDATADVNYWDVTGIEDFPYLDQNQAGQIRDKLVTLYGDPVQQQSFVLGSKYIMNGNGVKEPLWRPLFGNSFYFKIMDLWPNFDLFNESDNRRASFWSVALDYTYRDNMLRIVPSTEDSRLDAVLAKVGIISGQMINTEANSRRYVPPPPPGPLTGSGGGFLPPGTPGKVGGGTGFDPSLDPSGHEDQDLTYTSEDDERRRGFNPP